MTQQTIHGILTLITPQTIEEDIVDFFLDSEHAQGFTSLHVRGHTSQHAGMSVIEQVTGRQHQVQFQVLVSEAQAREICQRLGEQFDAGIVYWFSVTSLHGRLGETAGG